MLLLSAIGVLLVVDLVIEGLGRLMGDLAFDSQLWGSFADWAAAILPAAAILITVAMWNSDRDERHDADTQQRLLKMEIDAPTGARRYLRNKTGSDVTVCLIGNVQSATVVESGTDLALPLELNFEEELEVIVLDDHGRAWRLERDCLPRKMPTP